MVVGCSAGLDALRNVHANNTTVGGSPGAKNIMSSPRRLAGGVPILVRNDLINRTDSRSTKCANTQQKPYIKMNVLKIVQSESVRVTPALLKRMAAITHKTIK